MLDHYLRIAIRQVRKHKGHSLINILGPDHHGYIARLKASQASLGHDPEHVHKPHILLQSQNLGYDTQRLR